MSGVLQKNIVSSIDRALKKESHKVNEQLSKIIENENKSNWMSDVYADSFQLGKQMEPISPRVEIEGERPFSDEDDEGPESFTYQTVPAVIGQIAEGKCKTLGVDQMMPELKKLAVRGALSEREKHVFRYFRRRRITDLLQFMMNHLLASQPDDPLDFLRGLLDHCLLFRAGQLKEPPILYRAEHLESFFAAFDPLKTELITLQQYHNAMRTLMIRNYNRNPDVDENRNVSKRVFMNIAKLGLVGNLLDLIWPPSSENSGSSKKALHRPEEIQHPGNSV
ncbi:EF-hand calcium Hypothetical protein domain 10 [Nesidiocoris tenuis]|uniref:Uncharacterized protein n=1 Tax=Nesidiocoris tenuis TaxID=355587 RepID=A0ABN7B2H0_9HEMI|nr:EF-hand calcium Hypothetical protein domain 10 [Nesidiocoris tenuis]